MSKTLKSMLRLIIFHYRTADTKEFVRVPRRYTRVIFFAVVQCWEISIYTLSIVHAEFRLLYIASMPTVLPSDNQVTGFQHRQVWRGPRARLTEDSKFSGSQRPLRSHWLYGRSVTPRNTMTAKERDMGQEPMQFTCSSFGQQKGRGRMGAIKILQINYTKKKRQIYIEICTRPSLRRHHLYELCGRKRSLELRMPFQWQTHFNLKHSYQPS